MRRKRGHGVEDALDALLVRRIGHQRRQRAVAVGFVENGRPDAVLRRLVGRAVGRKQVVELTGFADVVEELLQGASGRCAVFVEFVVGHVPADLRGILHGGLQGGLGHHVRRVRAFDESRPHEVRAHDADQHGILHFLGHFRLDAGE